MRTSRASVPGLHDTRHHGPHLGARQLPGLLLRARARRIEHHGVEAFELLGRQRHADEIAHLGLDRLEALHAPGRCLQGRNCGPLLVHRQHAGATCQGKCEGAQATEEIGDALGLGRRRQHQAHHLGFRRLHGLHERPGRKLDVDAAEGQHRWPDHGHRLPVDHQSGEAMAHRQRRHARQVLAVELDVDEVHLHIETRRRGVDVDAGLRLTGEQRLQHLPQRRQRGHDLRHGDGAFGDVHDVVRRGAIEAEVEILAVTPCINVDAAPAGERHAEQLVDRRLDAAMSEGLDDDAALPGDIERVGHVLRLAPAAAAEMRAHRVDPRRMRAQQGSSARRRLRATARPAARRECRAAPPAARRRRRLGRRARRSRPPAP